MGFFSNDDKALRDARRELDEQHDTNRKALRAGDEKATRENLRLQDKVVVVEKNASRAARWLR
jgi:Arc/MetJ-type ribon-helix-helix transcriptional regulator